MMATTYQIAVIGDWESVMGFRALGLDTYPVTSVEEAREKVKELAKTDCAVIYLTEQLAKDMERGKDVSGYGFIARGQALLCKLLPHSLVMSVWMKQQSLK